MVLSYVVMTVFYGISVEGALLIIDDGCGISRLSLRMYILVDVV
jgi:hypothetical protein